MLHSSQEDEYYYIPMFTVFVCLGSFVHVVRYFMYFFICLYLHGKKIVQKAIKSHVVMVTMAPLKYQFLRNSRHCSRNIPMQNSSCKGYMGQAQTIQCIRTKSEFMSAVATYYGYMTIKFTFKFNFSESTET